jgi:LPXTG-motif cell wall-anchored protein
MSYSINRRLAFAMTSGSLLMTGFGTPSAQADSTANGTAADSPGILSGNLVQIPVNLPINVCGNQIDVVTVTLGSINGVSCESDAEWRSGTPTPAPNQNGGTPTPAPNQNGSTPTPAPNQNGGTPTPAPNQNGNTPTAAPDQNGTTPTRAPDQNGDTPAPDSDQNGDTPAPDTDQNGDTPTSGASSAKTWRTPGELAHTGSAALMLAPFAVASLTGGGALLRRRRRETQSH